MLKEESEKNAGSHWESNPGPLTSANSALNTELQQRDNHQDFTILCILHEWCLMLQLHTRQPLCMCCQNSVWSRPETKKNTNFVNSRV